MSKPPLTRAPLQWGETHNHVFGRTTNPYNRYMTPGGSSGGEGALVALRGSPLGVGTDIGGYVAYTFPPPLPPPPLFPSPFSRASDPPLHADPTRACRSVRIPSAFCGLYGLRPSYERLPYHGAANSLEGQESISSVLGPMANSLAALRVFTQAVLGARPWRRDPLVVRKDWDWREYALAEHGGRGARMCFAVMWDNDVVRPHPPVVRALERAGHRGK